MSQNGFEMTVIPVIDRGRGHIGRNGHWIRGMASTERVLSEYSEDPTVIWRNHWDWGSNQGHFYVQRADWSGRHVVIYERALGLSLIAYKISVVYEVYLSIASVRLMTIVVILDDIVVSSIICNTAVFIIRTTALIATRAGELSNTSSARIDGTRQTQTRFEVIRVVD
jgi:hypothetical protein